MKKLILIAFNLIMALFLLTGCMFDVSGENINPNPDGPVEPNIPDNPIIPDKPNGEMKLYSHAFLSMNTVVSFALYAPSKEIDQQVLKRVEAIYAEYDRVADDGFDSLLGQNYKSELAILNRDRIYPNPSKSLVELVLFAEKMQEETNGYYNPYLGRLNHLWKKYIDGYASVSQGEMLAFSREARETKVEYKDNTLKIIGDGLIDLGGIAKGYATNKAIEYLKKANVKHFILNAGNSNIVVGEKLDNTEFKVGISYVFGYPNKTPNLEVIGGHFYIDGKDTFLKAKANANLEYGEKSDLPKAKKEGDIYFKTDTAEYFMVENGAYRLMGTLTLTDILVKHEGVCTSNPGQQHKLGDKKVHHLINPMTGAPSNIRDSVTIIGLDSGRLDAYSTALFSMEDEEAIRFIEEHSLKGLLVKDDSVYYRTEGI